MAAHNKRPEHIGPPELFYGEVQARKYSTNSHMIAIQAEMSERAVELLALPSEMACYLLDIGCGSGLSGEVLTENGHYWVGIDISPHMLDVACEREIGGDLILGDMGHGIPFRPGTFDGVISISALQWLCNADRKEHRPPQRLYRFFSTLYSALIELMTQQAMKAGFTGGLVVDFPNSAKAKKLFLVLFAGGYRQLPKGLSEQESHHVKNIDNRSSRTRDRKSKFPEKGVQWIFKKKEQMRRKGKEVKSDSRYTARKRRTRF